MERWVWAFALAAFTCAGLTALALAPVGAMSVPTGRPATASTTIATAPLTTPPDTGRSDPIRFGPLFEGDASYESPVIAFGHGRAVVVWCVSDGGRFTRVEALSVGLPAFDVGEPVTLSPQASNRCDLTAVVDATGFAVAWSQEIVAAQAGETEIYLALLRRDATLRDDAAMRLTTSAGASERPRLAWTGEGFGLTWQDTRTRHREVYFAALDAEGTQQTRDLQLTNSAAGSGEPEIAWSGESFGLAWLEAPDAEPGLYFGTLDPDDGSVAAQRLISADDEVVHSHGLAWNGAHFGIVWASSSEPRSLSFAAVSAGGELAGDSRELVTFSADDGAISVVAADAVFGVAWPDSRDGRRSLLFARLTPDGAPISGLLVVSQGRSDPVRPSLAPLGEGFAAVWESVAGNRSSVYWAHGGFGCP